jgi:uncharacterized phage protein gp47/JayE
LPYPRPTLTTLRAQVLQDINAAQITDKNGVVLVALLQKAVLRVLANATAGMSYEHYGYLDWIALQAVPWTATEEFLEGWANLKGVYREQATPTQGTATFSGTNGTDFPAGTALTRSDGTGFTTTADTSVSSGSVTVTFAATVAGSAGNFDSGTQFSISNPIDGIIGTSTASTQTVPGTDTETDDSLRTRMLAAYAAPPQGGDRQDYIEWALAVPGVTRAWVNPNGMGAGTVVVYVMLDEAESAFGGIPQGSNGVAGNETRATAATGDQLTVANALFDEQPVTALVYACAPTPAAQNFSITGLGAANTASNQALMTSALQEMFLQLGNVGGTVNPESGAQWPSIPPSAWYGALEAITGLTNFDVPTPSAPITVSAGQLPTLGTISFAS